MYAASLVGVLLIVAGVFLALVYRDSGDGTTGNYIMIFLGFVATIVTNIVGLAKTHEVQNSVEEVKKNTIPTTPEEEKAE